NHSLDIVSEIKTIQENYPEILLTDLFQWAMINGAKALNIQDIAGSFEKGKKPGIVLIEGINNDKLNDNASSKKIL
ncbi:MAG: amidohydrolase family protein, partial [Ilyomonas sp.]